MAGRGWPPLGSSVENAIYLGSRGWFPVAITFPEEVPAGRGQMALPETPMGGSLLLRFQIFDVSEGIGGVAARR